jgi:hypothetical protein
MDWYRVTKTIHGRKYLYWQKTYRQGRCVKTLNKYIGPAGGAAHSTGSAYDSEPQTSLNVEINPDEIDHGAALQQQKDYVSILADVVGSHRARGLLKYFGSKSPADHTLDEVLVTAIGTSKKSARLDSIVGHLGFDSMDDAQKELDSFIELRAEFRLAKQQLKDLRAAQPRRPEKVKARPVPVATPPRLVQLHAGAFTIPVGPNRYRKKPRTPKRPRPTPHMPRRFTQLRAGVSSFYKSYTTLRRRHRSRMRSR